MLTQIELDKKISQVFPKRQAKVLTEVLVEAHRDLVKAGDFNELKSIVKDLAEAQKRTETRVEELVEAQKRTEAKVGELAEAQKRTELEIAKLTKGLNETRGELGGLSKSMSYAFENEAFRRVPGILKEKYDIEITAKLIREEIGQKEINLFGRARKNGREVFVVGESKLRLDERREKRGEDIFAELEGKVKAVKDEYGEAEIVRVFITHYATKGFLKKAGEKGVIVVQSFEW